MSHTDLPPHLVNKAETIRNHINSRLPPHTLLPKDISLPLDSTTLLTSSSILTPRQLEIIDQDAVNLVQSIQDKKYTTLEVTEAYCISASIAHQATNCLTYYDSESAFAQARELDRVFEDTGKLVGPLHGVVVSLKRRSSCT
jgi:amidase